MMSIETKIQVFVAKSDIYIRYIVYYMRYLVPIVIILPAMRYLYKTLKSLKS